MKRVPEITPLPSVRLGEGGLGTRRISQFASTEEFIAIQYIGSEKFIDIFSPSNNTLYQRLTLLSSASSSFAWMPRFRTADEYVLAVASVNGQIALWTLAKDSSQQFRPTYVKIPMKVSLRLRDREFSKLAFSKSGDVLVIASRCEIIQLHKSEEFEFTKSPIPFSTVASIGTANVAAIDIHPTGEAVAVCASHSVVIVGLKGNLNERLSKAPTVDVPSSSTEQEVGPDQNPKTVNKISFSALSENPPIACAWSKYGELLAVATSDGLLTVWNVVSESLNTVSVGEDVVIRNLQFVADAMLLISINDSSRVLLVNTDDDDFYDSNESLADPAQDGYGSLSTCLVANPAKNDGGVTVQRIGNNESTQIRQWQISNI